MLLPVWMHETAWDNWNLWRLLSLCLKHCCGITHFRKWKPLTYFRSFYILSLHMCYILMVTSEKLTLICTRIINSYCNTYFFFLNMVQDFFNLPLNLQQVLVIKYLFYILCKWKTSWGHNCFYNTHQHIF